MNRTRGASAAVERELSGRASSYRRGIAGIGLLLGVAAGIALCLLVVHDRSLDASRWGVLPPLATWWVVWAITVLCVFRVKPRLALAGILLGAAVLRAAAMTGPPSLSDDLYRYAWDGRVQHAGLNPYHSAPISSRLAFLRDPWLWPDDASCADLGRPPGCTRINRPEARTIYPPVAQLWFRAVTEVTGGGGRDRTWQGAAVAVDAATVALLLAALPAYGRDRRWVAAYALCPLAVLETASNAHVDGLALALVLAALLCLHRRRAGWCGALLGGAALVKLYPAVLLCAVAAVPERGRARWRTVGRAVAGFAAVVAAGYAPHVAAVGWRVLGYLPGYLEEEGYQSGERLLLLNLILPNPVVKAAGAAVLLLLAAFVIRRGRTPAEAGIWTMGGVLLLATPVQHWYALLLVGLLPLAGSWTWFPVAAAGYPYYIAVILAHPRATSIGCLAYGAALGIVAAGGWVRRGRTAVNPQPGETGAAVLLRRALRRRQAKRSPEAP